MQPHFNKHNLELRFLDTGSFIFSFKPIKSLIKDLTDFKEDFAFSYLVPSHELYSEDNKKGIGKMKSETLPDIDLDKAVFLMRKS